MNGNSSRANIVSHPNELKLYEASILFSFSLNLCQKYSMYNVYFMLKIDVFINNVCLNCFLLLDETSM